MPMASTAPSPETERERHFACSLSGTRSSPHIGADHWSPVSSPICFLRCRSSVASQSSTMRPSSKRYRVIPYSVIDLSVGTSPASERM